MKKLIPFLFFPLLLAACSESQQNAGELAKEAVVAGEAAPASDGSAFDASAPVAEDQALSDQATARKLIKEGTIRLEVDDYQLARDSILQLLKRMGGYAAGEEESRQSYRLQNSFELRVPVARFDAFMEALSKIDGKLTYRSSNVKDVTNAWQDLDLRIRNKKKLEERYLDLLTKATNMEDILRIERTLNDIRTEIEQMEGHMRGLNEQIAYSTVHLTLSQISEYKYEGDPKPNFFERILVAMQSGWDGLLNLIVGLFYLWPFFLGAAAIVFIVLRINQRAKRKR